MQLVVISNEVFFDGEAEIINQIFKEGLEYFHLRKPASSEKDIASFIDQIKTDFHHRISLHYHHNLASEFGIKRLHFTEKERNNHQLKHYQNLVDKGYFLTTSVHSVQDLKDLSKSFSYTFLSPVFDSISKSNYKGFTTTDFTLNDAVKPTKVIALGGVNEDNISKLKSMNFNGAAVLGYLWKTPQTAIENFLKLKKHVE